MTAWRLEELVRLDELQRQLVNLFPSRGSLDWHIRQHRGEYVSAGALLEHAGRWLAHPATFKRVALEIARRATAGEVGELVRLDDLQRLLGEIFPSRAALDWHLRQHKDKYTAAGALSRIKGRWLAHPADFKRIAQDITGRNAI